MKLKQLQLLAHLQENSREKLTTISKKTSIPISTLFDMLRELQGSVISKSTVLLNFEELGYHTRAQIFVKVASKDKLRVQKHFLCHSNVNNIYKINNGWDFVIQTVHKSVKELDRFLEKVSMDFVIENKEIYYLIDDIKREGFSDYGI